MLNSNLNDLSGDKVIPLIGQSKVMIEVKKHIEEIARYSDSTILITGESGTGKEVVAQYIHSKSPRKDKELVDISVSSISPNLLESELFGHEKGSFTDARTQKIGLFEKANGSTLFLDEIGTLSTEVQIKLLRVLETREFRRVGGTNKIKIDIRLIAATNDDLEEMMNRGEFRRDLFYRLDVVRIYLPPIRERCEDVILLADYFIKYYNNSFRKNVTSISKELKHYLLDYDFPGNVRELKNLVERGMIACKGDTLSLDNIQHKGYQKFNGGSNRKIYSKELTIKDLPEKNENYIIKVDKSNILTLKELENKYIYEVFKYYEGNKNKTSRVLGISRSSMYERINRGDFDEYLDKSQ